MDCLKCCVCPKRHRQCLSRFPLPLFQTQNPRKNHHSTSLTCLPSSYSTIPWKQTSVILQLPPFALPSSATELLQLYISLLAFQYFLASLNAESLSYIVVTLLIEVLRYTPSRTTWKIHTSEHHLWFASPQKFCMSRHEWSRTWKWIVFIPYLMCYSNKSIVCLVIMLKRIFLENIGPLEYSRLVSFSTKKREGRQNKLLTFVGSTYSI